MNDERRQYRASRPAPDLLSLHVQRSEEAPVEAVVLDVSVGGMGLVVAREVDPAFAPDEVVHVRLESPHLAVPIVTPSAICHRAERESTTVYGIQFVDWLGLLAQLPVELKPYFNQRGGRRLGIRACPEIKVEDDAGDFSFGAILMNISVSGLCFTAPRVIGELVGENGLIRVSLPVRCETGPLILSCNVRSREVVEDELVFNVCLVDDPNEDNEATRNTLTHFVRRLERKAKDASPPDPSHTPPES